MRACAQRRICLRGADRGTLPLVGGATTDGTGAGEPRRIFLVGATGTIGRATARALVARGHQVVCFVRPAGAEGARRLPELAGAEIRVGEVTKAGGIARDWFRGERFDTIVSCLASRTGSPREAWAIDHSANLALLEAGQAQGVGHFVLLSAICLQKPRLAFQHAKITFETALMASGMPYTIVRPTAFFKSLSGQVEPVRRGKPWLLFGDGRLTACKPISDADLAAYLVRCVEDPALRGRVLPIGGPGPAITPREQAEALFAPLGEKPRFRHVPVRLMDVIVGVLGALGRVVPNLRDKAEYARIGRYYAKESMLVWNEEADRYDAAATPETGADRLVDHYAELVGKRS
ncbi:NAD(P)H-binding protein [Sphingomonas glaciei]|uniref:Divinyl chlorophyllide a 8-vinyl-reductase, chloroplastic n=1 Tax=Sphingomonas glaciei TaxID=2938948 RepID=A0ABY5MYH9_9SPHN|nr:NAD(P)H-binding protein [Sphingomonas glaciei]UUR08846.1 NAD(P)H-binding protein [Sphingomonas glaciei]